MTPTLWMLDYGYEYTSDVMRRLADCGVTGLWCFDHSPEQQLGPSEFAISRTPEYADAARSAGFTDVRIQAPIGLPDWIPEDWLLKSHLGDLSNLPGPYEEYLGINLPGEVLAHRMTSYWNPRSEKHFQDYVAALREAVEPNATIVPAIGASCGEYFFPSSFYASDKGKDAQPWWFDPYAMASYDDSRPTTDEELSRDQWWRAQRREILERRFSWYSERWTTSYTEDPPRKLWSRGNVDIDDLLARFDPRPRTICWCGMRENLLPSTLRHAQRFATYCGAEGAANAANNLRKIIEFRLPIAGLLCGPTFPQYEGGFSEQVYGQIKEAVDVCRGG